MTNGGTGQFVQKCGASILTTTALLSAASCFVSGGITQNVAWWQARVGSERVSEGTTHNIRLIIPHENFSEQTNEHNIAVLRTATVIAYTASVGRAFIAGQAYPLPAQIPVQAIGWGKSFEGGPSSDALLVTDIFTVPESMCVSRYSQLSPVVNDLIVCAGWLDVGIRGQCEGDEGSPLIHDGIVVGVHTWNQECASHQYPGLNTRISNYTSWIILHSTAN